NGEGNQVPPLPAPGFCAFSERLQAVSFAFPSPCLAFFPQRHHTRAVGTVWVTTFRQWAQKKGTSSRRMEILLAGVVKQRGGQGSPPPPPGIIVYHPGVFGKSLFPPPGK